jgi:hypothetical protein
MDANEPEWGRRREHAEKLARDLCPRKACPKFFSFAVKHLSRDFAKV